MLYCAGASDGKTYWPSPLETTEVLSPVPRRVATTVALGMAAPEGSVTVPEIRANPWPKTAWGTRTDKTQRRTNHGMDGIRCFITGLLNFVAVALWDTKRGAAIWSLWPSLKSFILQLRSPLYSAPTSF